MKLLIQDKLIELYRIRFEHFYNGVLTFDIHYCTYDCLFCFSKEGRYKVENNLNSGRIKEVYLNNLYFFDESIDYYGNRVNFNENSKIYENFFEKEFGSSDDKNNLIPKRFTGEIIIKTAARTLAEKIQYILKLSKFPIKSVRFSSGDVLNNNKCLDWFNEFIVEFFDIFLEENLVLIIETNGSRFNTQKQKDPSYAKFLELLKNETHKEKIHIRISLKNPNDAFYRVLTKKGDYLKLERAIDFGIYCLRHNISFHYTIFANYLSIDDLIKFKKSIMHKLDTIDGDYFNNRFNTKEDAFNYIFKLIEYERLFYYKTIFKEYLVAHYLIKGDHSLKKYIQDLGWSKQLSEMASIYKIDYNGRHKAYYKRFLNRTVPKFKKNGFKIFENDLIQYKKLKKIYEAYLSQENTNLEDYEIRDEPNLFDGYEGILDFWELAFGSRFLHYRPNKEEISLHLKFQNVSIVNRIPLYPGIFYLYDFWAQSKPNYFIYTLYTERKCIKLKNDEYYIYSLNCNPDTHAHTDISRAIPILIKKSNFRSGRNDLIEDLQNYHVIDIKDAELKLRNVVNYEIDFENFEINIPFFILELKEINYNYKKIKNTPFLGSIGALYDNLWFNEEFTPYLNYFYWTGIEYNESVNPSFRKAIKYLFDFQSIQKDEEDLDNWLQLKIIEPKDEILALLKLKSKLDDNKHKFILNKISQCLVYIEEHYKNSDKVND